MTVDRDQTRRDIEVVSKWTMSELHPAAQQFAMHLAEACDGLLSELEQADQERDDYRDEARETADRWDAAEARLAKVPALVEAAKLIRAYEQAGGNDWWEAHTKLYRALAVWEQE